MSHRVAATSLDAAAARMGGVLRDIAEGTRERFECFFSEETSSVIRFEKANTFFLCVSIRNPRRLVRKSTFSPKTRLGQLGRFPKIARVRDSKKAPASRSVYARAYENWRA
jgi:hypothetical protein